jgi:putative glutamine amidotransferase
MALLIGIPTHTRITRTGVPADEMRHAYAAAVANAGGLPVLLPPVGPLPLERLDGVLLAGGDDVDPRHYGQVPHPLLGDIDPARDVQELALARACIARNLPVLGLCRGHQVLTIAGGGTLFQDLPSLRPSATIHDSELDAAHPVVTASGSRLATFCGAQVSVNSRHHQATDTLGAGWNATAWADDGLIEGIELTGHRFAIGVQWHPEDLQLHGPHRALLAAFVSACTR